MLGIVESLANPLKDEGEWIARLDLKESGSKLLVEEQPEVGSCEEKCRTIARAAEDILEYTDTDAAELLWKVSRFCCQSLQACLREHSKQPGVGSCEEECRTIARAAEDILEYTDTDAAELLWKVSRFCSLRCSGEQGVGSQQAARGGQTRGGVQDHHACTIKLRDSSSSSVFVWAAQGSALCAQGEMSRAQFTNWLCREQTSACKGKPPKLPADRKPGPPFKVADPQERSMAKLMQDMKVRCQIWVLAGLKHVSHKQALQATVLTAEQQQQQQQKQQQQQLVGRFQGF